MEKVLTRIYGPLLLVLCAGLLCGHMLPMYPSGSVFHLCVLLAALTTFLYKTQMPRMFYGVALYYAIYGIWTCVATPIWPQELDFRAMSDFLFVPLLMIALLRLLLVNPSKALKVYSYVCAGYLLSMAAMGITEILTGWHLPTSMAYHASDIDQHVATGLCHNMNDYSVLLVMSALYFFAYWGHFGNKKKTLLGFAALCVCVPIIIRDRCWTGLAVVLLAAVLQVMLRIKKRKLLIALVMAALVILCSGVVICWDIIAPRLQIYGLSFTSLFDSYGLGFGVNGDRYYMTLLNNYDLTHGLTNAHSYLFQILLTSGLPIFLFYCSMIVWMMRSTARQGRDLFWILPLLYLLLLFSPSSSLWLWGHYVFFCGYLCYAVYAETIEKKQNTL